MHVAFAGNFTPPHSTENHLARALENNGHLVDRWQESEPRTWENLGEIPQTKIDLILWVWTGWDWSRAGVTESWVHSRMRRMLRFARDNKIPSVSYHLDRWVGLKRVTQLDTEPFFESDFVITADGGHPEEFARRAINHRWFPAGVSADETVGGMFRSDLASPLAFVGSHDGGYHPEHQHRHDLVQWLKDFFPIQCAFWPKPGEHAVRGTDLRDLYSSVDVLVGDSAFAGDGVGFYASDRIPETLGRGGYLLHPDVPGVTDGTPWKYGPTWTSGEHLSTWPANDWNALAASIDRALGHPAERREIAAEGREHTVRHHSYERRMEQLLEMLADEGVLGIKKATKAPAKKAAAPRKGTK